jgi:hypothetical protein
METAPLKSFATWARNALIREVTARIDAVLAPGSSQRVEQASAVAALEKTVGAAGGGHKGRAAVADKVAYTWFNRIIALRFMDANGYTGIGVVSPQAGLEVGQPEILAEAKRGVIDTEVVSQKTRAAVAGLLDGTRVSGDPQGEAYALLLADYCRHWNRAMPFMFEREGDYTELLIPANLLADDSVLNRSVKVLTEDVCKDVEIIGWLYQFYISERKDEVFAGFKKNKKAGADEIPAATQLFTPHWIVRYLVENSLGRLWLLNRPSSGLVNQMDYYIAPVDEETDVLKITTPEELKVIDPACGSGHMLTYAFDLLYAIYEEEGYAPTDIPGLILTHNLYGTEIDPRAGALAAFALTMKARAKQRTFFNKQVEPNICVIEPVWFSTDEIDFLAGRGGDPVQDGHFWTRFKEADILGSLIQPDPDEADRLARHLETLDDGGDMLKADVLDRARRVVAQAEYLTPRYSIAIANPPYMGSKNMSTELAVFVLDHFPDSKADLFATFIERCQGLVGAQGGLIAMITMQSWMFLASFEKLRAKLLHDAPPVTMAHLGERAFDSIGGSVVSTTAFVLEEGRAQTKTGVYVRLIDGKNEAEKSSLARAAIDGSSSHSVYRVQPQSFVAIPGAPLAYWLSDAFFSAFDRGTPLREIAEPRQGMATADNARFVRQWWEVSARRCSFDSSTRSEAKTSGARWFPYTDGGDFRRWYGNRQSLVNWGNDGQELRDFSRSVIRNPDLYFRESVAWSAIGSGVPAFRYMPVGSLFSNAGMALFADHDTLKRLAAVCNSTTGGALFAAVAPTMNLGVGEIAKLPVLAIPEGVEAIVDQLIERAKLDWDDFETSWDFQRPSLLPASSADSLLRGLVVPWAQSWREAANAQRKLEAENNRIVAAAYGLAEEIALDVPQHRVSLRRNLEFIFGPGRTEDDYVDLQRASIAEELVSYAVGCMFGRYSLDEAGLIVADQGGTLQDYLAKVPSPTFPPDKDNVIPVVDGDWFEDDIVARFRQFLRAAFGDQHFEENLRFVTESLGVKNLRDYFVRSFYKDHVQRYKKRPIYWLFSSPKGSFNALIYMHRYTPSTVSTVLNEYLREFQAKLKASLEHAERSNNAKEADRLRKVLLELDEYEHVVLYPLATQNVVIDLDDGVKANYPRFGDALKKIPGLEAIE